jgi:hypothetical protein
MTFGKPVIPIITNIKLEAKNILLVKIRLKRVIYKLRIRDKLKIILRSINIFLIFI